jgi:small GTP-binding protein
MSQSALELIIERAKRQKPAILDLDLSDQNLSLSVLSPSIGELTSLKQLILGRKRPRLGEKNINQLTTLPSEISQLINLETLVIANNKLSHFPIEITELRNLTSLDLSRNQITEIPDAIAQLKNLRSLDLSNNQIRKIPEAIAELPNLTSLNVGGNPIVTPPLEIVEKGIRAIQEYFRQIKIEGEDYLYEAKLLIVGEAGAGKTTLANIIKNQQYKLQQEDTTKGIEVLRWTFARDDGKRFSVNIWDFGGQEIYHATHQYFLTKRSLYLLVADNRKEDTDFYYWLNTIDLLSENSPVLIVNNKKENRQREININQLRGEFDNLIKVIATNLANNNDRDAIIRDCKYHLNQLPHIGDRLPITWVKVRDALERDRRNYISHEEYLQICEDNGYREDDYEFKLSEYFHDLGICLHFQKDTTSPLYNIVILKPKWATDAAYAVLDKQEIIDNFGRFTKQDLAKIWSDPKYRGMHDKLLELYCPILQRLNEVCSTFC